MTNISIFGKQILSKKILSRIFILELGSDQCKTVLYQTETKLGIRNVVRIYRAKFVGELVLGAAQEEATKNGAIPVGRDFDIEHTTKLQMLFEDQSEDDTGPSSCNSRGLNPASNTVSCK
mgnify:CR=1 FL=1